MAVLYKMQKTPSPFNSTNGDYLLFLRANHGINVVNKHIIVMPNKLQELTEKLYNEGLSKGKQDGEELLRQAHSEADDIIAKAKAEAARIVAESQKEADDLKTKVTSDLKMAATQSISVTKQEMERLVVTNITRQAASECLSSADFVKEMIKAIVGAFNPANATPVDLDIVLPESLRAQIEPFIANEVRKQFKSEIRVSYSDKVKGGFNVMPQGEGYMLQFTDEEFSNLIASYLRPATKKILFGKA